MQHEEESGTPLSSLTGGTSEAPSASVVSPEASSATAAPPEEAFNEEDDEGKGKATVPSTASIAQDLASCWEGPLASCFRHWVATSLGCEQARASAAFECADNDAHLALAALHLESPSNAQIALDRKPAEGCMGIEELALPSHGTLSERHHKRCAREGAKGRCGSHRPATQQTYNETHGSAEGALNANCNDESVAHAEIVRIAQASRLARATQARRLHLSPGARRCS